MTENRFNIKFNVSTRLHRQLIAAMLAGADLRRFNEEDSSEVIIIIIIKAGEPLFGGWRFSSKPTTTTYFNLTA